MAIKKAARVGDPHTCEQIDDIPHIGGEIIEGAKTVTIEGKPAARVDDPVDCLFGSLETEIVTGSKTVFIEDKAAAMVSSETGHGSVVSDGASSVFIGDEGPGHIYIGGNGNPVHIGENVYLNCRPGSAAVAENSTAVVIPATGVDSTTTATKAREPAPGVLHVIVLVPGTVTPLNTHRRSMLDYFTTASRLHHDVIGIMAYYRDAEVVSDFHWNGNNHVDDRQTAGNLLWKTLHSRYGEHAAAEIQFHLIGHSHGGNVIHELTRKAKEECPSHWKIRSIVYLSTPFMPNTPNRDGELWHQVDTTHFHDDCQIINIVNQYDITQRVIANYSLHWLQEPIDTLLADEMVKQCISDIKSCFPLLAEQGVDIGTLIAEDDTSLFDVFHSLLLVPAPIMLVNWLQETLTRAMKATSLKGIWESTYQVLDALDRVCEAVLVILARRRGLLVNAENQEQGLLSQSTAEQLTTLFSDLFQWASTAKSRCADTLEKGAGVFQLERFVRDLHLTDAKDQHQQPGIVSIIQRLMQFDSSLTESPLFELLDGLFAQRIHRFANMRVNPNEQLRETGYEAINIDLTGEDGYHSLGKLKIYDDFITMLETNQTAFGEAYDDKDLANEKKYRKEFIAMLAAQVLYQPRMAKWLHVGSTAFSNRHRLALLASPGFSLLLSAMGATTHRHTKAALAALDTLIQHINKGMQELGGLYHDMMVNDDNGSVLSETTPGSLAYLAVTAHSVSRQQLHPAVKTQLETVLEETEENKSDEKL